MSKLAADHSCRSKTSMKSKAQVAYDLDPVGIRRHSYRTRRESKCRNVHAAYVRLVTGWRSPKTINMRCRRQRGADRKNCVASDNP
ncbi:unnamed protein product [Soboliphyme baturini]|uniref:Integrase n=1 Tax=Soboliphyme baturini TaxID=241478 RepID=A0A183II42_9BILA|nr:unnamed protein product [Soboliphyme baturini]